MHHSYSVYPNLVWKGLWSSTLVAAVNILYSGKFSRGPVFTVFADHRLKLNSQNKFDCTVHNGWECVHPQKLNPRNGRNQPSAKIELCKNFPLYGRHKVKVYSPIHIRLSLELHVFFTCTHLRPRLGT